MFLKSAFPRFHKLMGEVTGSELKRVVSAFVSSGFEGDVNAIASFNRSEEVELLKLCEMIEGAKFVLFREIAQEETEKEEKTDVQI